MINFHKNIQYKKLIFNIIFLQSINLNIINAYDFIDKTIVQYCDIADDLLEIAIDKAKKLYIDNGGECLSDNNVFMNELLNIPITNVGNLQNKEQIIKKVQIAPDFRIKLEFNQTKTFGILKDTKIILVPEYKQGDIYLVKFQCYTNFDIFYPTNDSRFASYAKHNTSSVLNSLLSDKERKGINNCIYLNNKEQSWHQVNW